MDYFGPVQVDMKRFSQMYRVVSAIPVILLLLTFVLWFTSREGWSGDPAAVPVVQYVIFGVLALATVPIALWLRRSSMQRPVPGAPSPAGSAVVDPESAAVASITMAATIGMAVPEISVLLGFVLGFLTESWTPYVPFAAYGALGWIIMFPRPSQVREWYARLVGQAPAAVPAASL